MNHRLALVSLALVTLLSRDGTASSIQYGSYLVYGGRDVLEMPAATFDVECERILGTEGPQDTSSRAGTGIEGLYRETVETDLAEFAAAVHDLPEAETLVADYRALRNSLSVHAIPWIVNAAGRNRSYGSLERLHRSHPTLVPQRPGLFDMSPHEGTLARLPAEFAAYLRGAAAYYAWDWDTAIEHFTSVLELPAEARSHRSTWAAFMLGKTWLNKEPAQAIPFFEQTRTLAEEGFADSLNLAAAGVGWQAYAEMASGQYVAAIHRYAGVDGPSRARSLRVVCRRALSAECVDSALVHDGLSRQIVTAWVIAHPRRKREANGWLAALDEFEPEGVVAEAERLAWLSYQRGDMEGAGRWLSHCPPHVPYAQWVRAKLLLREGKIDEGASLLDHLERTFPEGHLWQVDSRDEWVYPFDARTLVREDLGFALLKKGDYAGSLRAFLQAKHVPDATFVAERVLTVQELQESIEAQSGSPATASDEFRHPYPSWARGALSLEHLLARRWAREGRWDKAAEIHTGELKQRASEMHERITASRDESLPPRTRAEHLFEIGRIIRTEGPALFNPALIPRRGANFKRAEGFPPDLAERIERSQEPYPKMNHFVPVAADYMWQAAKLLPDNDPLTAHALYLGGVYLKRKDPMAADRFYKALVRRNPNLLIAQQADKLRWFPREFTDTILYWPRPEPRWYHRKRNLAAAALAASAALGILAVAGWAAARRVRKPGSASSTP